VLGRNRAAGLQAQGPAEQRGAVALRLEPESLSELARTAAQIALLRGAAPSRHALESLEGFHGSNQHGLPCTLHARDHVEAEVHPVDPVHVRVTRREEHRRVARGRPRARVRRRIVRGEVGLGLDDASDATALHVVVNEKRSEQPFGRGLGAGFQIEQERRLATHGGARVYGSPAMPTEELVIPIDDPVLDSVSAIFERPEKPRSCAILLAHGAGAPMDSDFMVRMAAELVARGFAVMRFQYGYMERARREEKRRPPDRGPALLGVHRAAIAALRERTTGPILLAGKSLGGRMSTLLAADGGVDAEGLILLGYPLHPAGKPERLRVKHLPDIELPALFLQGTRDALCDLALLYPALETYGGDAELHIVEGADHGFAVLKRSGRTNDEVFAELTRTIDEWVRVRFPA